VVSFVSGLIYVIPAVICWALIVAASAGGGGEEVVLIAVIPMAMIMLGLGVLVTMFVVPFIIRAQITQDFASSFDIGWCIGFVKLMFGQLLIQGILFYLASMLLLVAGLLVCFVGYIPAAGWVFGASQHMLAQFYEAYLSRGGKPVEGPIIEAELS
jgi:hypothetical protein